MQVIVEKFLERPLSHKIALWLGSVLFVAFVFWQYVYKDKMESVDKLQETVEKLNGQITTERRLARNLVKFREEVKDLDLKLKFALQELPDKREIPDLLSSISTLARDAGLEVSLFKPNLDEIIRDFYAEVQVSLSVEGTFHQITTFFDEVAHLSRIVNINSIVLRDIQQKDRPVAKADCIATTFRYLDDAERAAKTTEAADQAKKRRR